MKHSTIHFRNRVEHKTNTTQDKHNLHDNISLAISGDLVTNSIRKLCSISDLKPSRKMCAVIGAIKRQTAADFTDSSLLTTTLNQIKSIANANDH